ncbi:MAG TPA: aspartyl/asparaginyl beta-hydroxylase domain-containing protein [Pseudolabrys sp.]
MDRFTGTCEELCEVDPSALVEWIASIPLDDWPQQDRMTAEYPYPAMVSRPDWHDFHETVQPIVSELMEHFPAGTWPDHKMISMVVPGQHVEPHDDIQSETWRVRVHVPLVSNEGALMTIGGEDHHLEVGKAYLVNTEVEHSLANLGDENRIHFFFDVREGSK